MAIGGGGLGLLIVIVIALLTGDPRILQQFAQPQAPQAGQQQVPGKKGDDQGEGEFIGVVLRDTEKVWSKLFQEFGQGVAYREPRLVMFSGQVQSACGVATAAVGPFYCPGDQKVYIDPAFFETLAKRHGAKGDFAQAYVIAHEVAHHVQKLVGFSSIVDKVRQRGNEIATNQASVRLELQADFLAGVWAHHAQRDYSILEEGDVEEAIRAANQIGDDTLMKESIGYAIPERFTHGTSEQRVRWFIKGLKSGSFGECQQLFDLDYSEL
jgi:hypothetical protein